MPDEKPDFHVGGLDLGQVADFSALIVLAGHGAGGKTRFVARGLKRWPLGTKYPAIVDDLKRMYDAPPLAGSVLGIDRTGCGLPVFDSVVAAGVKARLRPILITAGADATPDGDGFRVPKRELAASVGVLLQSGRLELPATLPERETLARELRTFKAKITTAGTEVYEAGTDWRSAPHDDLVLALAMAAWLGTHRPVDFGFPAAGGRRQALGERPGCPRDDRRAGRFL